MEKYVTVGGHELTLNDLGADLAKTCLALKGLQLVLSKILATGDLGEKTSSLLIVAHMALLSICSQAEELLPE